MSDYKTLQEIHNMFGITRRAIQGYEEIGLVKAVDKNKYGYLLYGEKEIERIQEIKMYQEFGFKLKEIKELIDVPRCILKAVMEKRIIELREQQKKLNALITQVEVFIEQLDNE